MKKLMMVAAIICAATAAQATASFKWTTMSVKGHDGSGNYSGAATLYAYYNGEVVASWDGTMSNGLISKTVSSDSLEVGNFYKFEYTMTDSDNWVFTASYPGTIKAQSTTPTIAFGSSGNWAEPAVPEPTSGLLMLVGMGLLGLKRKRA